MFESKGCSLRQLAVLGQFAGYSTTNTGTRTDGSHPHRTQNFNNKKPVIPCEYRTTAYSGTKHLNTKHLTIFEQATTQPVYICCCCCWFV